MRASRAVRGGHRVDVEVCELCYETGFSTTLDYSPGAEMKEKAVMRALNIVLAELRALKREA